MKFPRIGQYKSSESNTIIFFDQDVGSDIGITQRFRSYKDRYVRRLELPKMRDNLRDGDFICYINPLGRNLFYY